MKKIIRERSKKWWSSFNHQQSQYSKDVLRIYTSGKTATTITDKEIAIIYIIEASDAQRFLFQ